MQLDQNDPIPNHKELKQQEHLPQKSSLCRFFVRGLCNLKRQECYFSHGIDDIDYRPWQEGEVVEVDYLKDTEFTQRKAVKGPKNYINLYDFQKFKKYSLEHLNNQRALRTEVRGEMHRQMFHDFINLLQIRYPGVNLTEDFLVREYTRVGFNKLMTRIKFAHLASYLCDAEDSKYFRKTMVMPPTVKKETTFIFKRAPEEEIIKVYRRQYERIIEEGDRSMEEAAIKKKLFHAPIPHEGIPPLSLLLKEKRLSFTDFLEVLNGSSIQDLAEKIRLEAKPEEMVEAACVYLDKQGTTRLVQWNQLYLQLSKLFKINNGNVLNQVKPLLILQGYQFLYFPTVQFIHHHKFGYDFRTEMFSNCTCEFRNKIPQQQLALLDGERQELAEGQSVDMNSLQSVVKYGPHILKSKILGVDLEGSLRRGGFVQMVQMNNGKNTFLFDIFSMEKEKDLQGIALTKKLLRNVMVNEEILKIFHDCRHDSLALHLFLQTCITNVFDTSATETVLIQLQAYQELNIVPAQQKIPKAKNLLQQCSNIKTLGLNQILKRYNASHGVNRHKDRFHKMWSQGEVEFFSKRPMHPDYREYCIKDVLDLPEIYHKIEAQHLKETIDLFQWLASSYVRQGFNSSKQ